ncbi:hypothetical protein ACJIZ3_012534 [Penstemon smallii]|uniref:Uncharacterized protein n=1 Tax=Penstemon smallii TaxID=265156 RepID=A0ABD3UMC1_9LAMI
MDEEWKLSRSISQKSSSKSSKKNPFNLSRSCSQKTFGTTTSSTKSSSSSSSSYLSRNSSQRCTSTGSESIGRKCSNLAKEQKAKFYIVKRCITMLVSWKKNNGDHS